MKRSEEKEGVQVLENSKRANGPEPLQSNTKGQLKASGHEFTVRPVSIFAFFSSYI